MLENPNGVELGRLRMGCRRAMWYLEHAYALEGEVLVIFHTNDGEHMEGSLHFKNRAFDFRLPERDADERFRRYRLALGPDYDLLNEGDHGHLEYDPK